MKFRKGLSSSNRHMAHARRRDPLPAAPAEADLPYRVRRPAKDAAGTGDTHTTKVGRDGREHQLDGR